LLQPPVQNQQRRTALMQIVCKKTSYIIETKILQYPYYEWMEQASSCVCHRCSVCECIQKTDWSSTGKMWASI